MCIYLQTDIIVCIKCFLAVISTPKFKIDENDHYDFLRRTVYIVISCVVAIVIVISLFVVINFHMKMSHLRTQRLARLVQQMQQGLIVLWFNSYCNTPLYIYIYIIYIYLPLYIYICIFFLVFIMSIVVFVWNESLMLHCRM